MLYICCSTEIFKIQLTYICCRAEVSNLSATNICCRSAVANLRDLQLLSDGFFFATYSKTSPITEMCHPTHVVGKLTLQPFSPTPSVGKIRCKVRVPTPNCRNLHIHDHCPAVKMNQHPTWHLMSENLSNLTQWGGPSLIANSAHQQWPVEPSFAPEVRRSNHCILPRWR